MFFPRSDALILTESQLKSLRTSINKPVVVTEELAGGPARAAIAAYSDGGGSMLGVTVVVRSLKSNQAVYYDFTEEIANEAELGIASDAAISFCEGMGFVIGDDALAERGLESRKVGLQFWREVTGEALQQAAYRRGGAATAVHDEELELETEELLLDELVTEDLKLELDTPVFKATKAATPAFEPRQDRTEVLDPDALRKPAAPARSAKPTLSRFRSAEQVAQACGESVNAQTENSTESDSNSQAIGRLKLIKRRGEGVEKASWLCRILRAF